jgi:hypothetical protein
VVRRAVVLLLVLAGCARVAPYRRGPLAHPTMTPEHGASPARDHVEAVHEGAAGGTTEVTSGCGCN